MMADLTSLVKHVPDGDLSRQALELAIATLPQAILNHSVRTYLFAKAIAAREESIYADEKSDHLFLACLFHDFGATEDHNHAERFEVCGADAAVNFMNRGAVDKGKHMAADSKEIVDVSHSEVWDVWTAIALHTSAGIAERIHPLARFVRLGVLVDFRQRTRESLALVDYGVETEKEVPRLGIEKVLADAVVSQAMDKKEGEDRNQKAPAASWPGILLRSHLEDPSWEGVNRAF
jgi:hypothetical protein